MPVDITANIYLRFGKDAFKIETAKARLFNLELPDKNGRHVTTNLWIPKSVTPHYAPEGETIALTVAGWYVQKNGLDLFLDPEWIAAGCPD